MQNFAFKFQAVAEKTAKNVGATLFCRTLYADAVWNPHGKGDIKRLEKVQREQQN